MNLNGIIGHDRELKYLLSLKTGEGIPHSVLFTGQRGIGKRLIAGRFIQSMLCRGTDSPCGECSSCRQVAAGSFPDLIILERDDKGKIPVGNRDKLMPGSVRWLIERLSRTPSSGYYCVIIDGVDTISEAGQNALLKTIEEPYSDAYIFLIAESRTGILPTIISRCIEIPFQPLKNDQLMNIPGLKGMESPEKELIMAISGGSADVALKLFDAGVFDEIRKISSSISGFVRGSREEMFRYYDFKEVPDSEFLLTVLINIYSFMLRSGFKDETGFIPEDLFVDQEDAVKIVRILLALKRGLGNNLNVKNILKGFIYSFSDIDSYGFPGPDFSWVK